MILISILISPKYSLAEENLEVNPLIQTSLGFSGVSFKYLKGEP